MKFQIKEYIRDSAFGNVFGLLGNDQNAFGLLENDQNAFGLIENDYNSTSIDIFISEMYISMGGVAFELEGDFKYQEGPLASRVLV